MILRKAYAGYLQPRILDAPWQGLAVNALAGAVNGGWCWTLIRNGRRLRSPSLVADGRHLLMAVISSGGVLVGVALAALTGWTVLDPALAAGVAVNILWSGWGVMQDLLGGLMDEAVAPKLLARVRDLHIRACQWRAGVTIFAPAMLAGSPSLSSISSCQDR